MSFDLAQILAPTATGPLAGVAIAPAGVGAVAVDFAAVLGSLAGPPSGATPPLTAGSTTLAPAMTPSRAGIASDEGPSAPGDAPYVDALDLALQLDPALQIVQPMPSKAEAREVPADDGREDDADMPASEPPRTDGLPFTPPPLQILIASAAPSREAAPEAGASTFVESPATAQGQMQFQAVASEADAPPPVEPGQIPADPEGASLAPSAPGPAPRSDSQPPPALTFALAAGVLKVTGQVAAAVADAVRPQEPEVATRMLEVMPPIAEADPKADPNPVPEAVRQGLVPAATPPDVRPAEPRRNTPAARPSGSAPATPNAQPAKAEIEAPEAIQLAAALPARPLDPSAGPSPGSSQGVQAATDEADDALPPPRGADPQGAPAFASAPTQGRTEAPEAPPVPARATPETVAALSAQMAKRLDDGTTRFELELNPGDLGRVDVRLEIDASGGIRAAFTFEHAHSASELGRRADELQKSLESAGFNLSGGLSFDVAGDRSQGRSPAWAETRDERPRPPAAPEPDLAREGASQIADALTGRRPSARSGVDIRI